VAQQAPPQFIVVGGPSGVGKSTSFPLEKFSVDHFNVDIYCSNLNNNSFTNFTPELREVGLRACDEFVRDHIATGKSVAIEASLRRDITFDQVRLAKDHGFTTRLIFLGNDDVWNNIRRVRARGLGGGHAAPPERLRDIYRGSMANFPRALREFDTTRVYDNTAHKGKAVLVLVTKAATVSFARDTVPTWLRQALRGTDYEKQLPQRNPDRHRCR
jgi:predicted ABC-type ATPase